MTSTITDEQISALTADAEPLSLVILRWTSQRHRDGADAIEREHQRRLVTLRRDGMIAVLAPVLSGGLAGVLMMRTPVDEADRIIAEDPCVLAGMQTYEVHSCLGIFDDRATA